MASKSRVFPGASKEAKIKQVTEILDEYTSNIFNKGKSKASSKSKKKDKDKDPEEEKEDSKDSEKSKEVKLDS